MPLAFPFGESGAKRRERIWRDLTSSVNFVDSFPEGEAKDNDEPLAFPFGESGAKRRERIKGRTDEIYFQ